MIEFALIANMKKMWELPPKFKNNNITLRMR